MKQTIFLLAVVLLFSSCSGSKDPQAIVDQSILVAGGENFEDTEIEFQFRNREYGYKKVGGKFEYMRLFKDSASVIRDVLTNDGFAREIDGIPVEVPDTMAVKYSNSINSVIYFALLPYGLNDPAVNKEYIGESMIKGKAYHKVRVTFNQEGGGEDFQDVFFYWIGRDDSKIDYLAYTYLTDGGGIRFREAYNERYIDGVRFVDYINYKPSGEIGFEEIEQSYLNNGLTELSKIELRDIKVNKLDLDS